MTANLDTVIKSYQQISTPKKEAGVVVWDASFHSGIEFQTHKFSLLDSLITASNFLFKASESRESERHTLIVVQAGLSVCAILETLPMFIRDNDYITDDCPISYRGSVLNMCVFYNKECKDQHFKVTNNHYCVEGRIINYKDDK